MKICSPILKLPGSFFYSFFAARTNHDSVYLEEERLFVFMSCHPENEELDQVEYWKLPSNNLIQEGFPKFHSLRIAPIALRSGQNYILSIQIEKSTVLEILLKIEQSPETFNQLTESFTKAIKDSFYCILNTERPIFERKLIC